MFLKPWRDVTQLPRQCFLNLTRFAKSRTYPERLPYILKGHCHGHFLAKLVKWHQNYDQLLLTMQEILRECKGKEIV